MSRSFRAAAEACEALRQHVRQGLQALQRADRERVRARDPRTLTGSINLDAALADSLPNAPRWDYGVGHRPTTHAGELVYWIEVHPATDGQVSSVEAKLEWLKGWLRSAAPELSRMKRRFIWVSSGDTSLTPMSPALRRLAQKGCVHVGRRCVMD